jgi:hypothetical protein
LKQKHSIYIIIISIFEVLHFGQFQAFEAIKEKLGEICFPEQVIMPPVSHFGVLLGIVLHTPYELFRTPVHFIQNLVNIPWGDVNEKPAGKNNIKKPSLKGISKAEPWIIFIPLVLLFDNSTA